MIDGDTHGRAAIRRVAGGITAAKGFAAGGISCGIKKSGALDLALILSENDCAWTGVFTTNSVKAHPVLDALAKKRAAGPLRAVLINSGSANACTGPAGMADLKRSLRGLSKLTGLAEPRLLMASTGVIGERLPAARILAGLPHLIAEAAPNGHHQAARAIMTTDTFPKEAAVRVATSRGTFTIGGMAKGAGMIHPNMATMLAFITTDAAVADRKALARSLRLAADESFNRLNCDGDTSTNDTLLLMAGGASGVSLSGSIGEAFDSALAIVCRELSLMVAADTEGATKLLTISIRGARNDVQARLAANTVAGSLLVKTAIHGRDPNWGRIMAALGRSGAVFNPAKVNIDINNVPLVVAGVKNPAVSEAQARRSLAPKLINIGISLGSGRGSSAVYSADLTADYIKINASYRS